MRTITMEITENEHKKIKILATKRGKTIKDFILYLFENYKNSQEIESYEFDERYKENMKDLKTGDKTYN